MTRHAGLGGIQIEADVQGVRVVDVTKGQRLTGFSLGNSCKIQ